MVVVSAQLAMAQAFESSDNAAVQDALKALDAAEAAHQAAWEAVPLTIRKGLFVEAPATAFGSYVPREDNNFAPGEKLHMYLEPIGFAYRPQGRLFAVQLSFDLALYDESGKEVFRQGRFSAFDYQGRAKVRELFLNMEVELTGAPPASYVVGVTALDLVGEKISEFRLPFRLGT